MSVRAVKCTSVLFDAFRDFDIRCLLPVGQVAPIRYVGWLRVGKVLVNLADPAQRTKRRFWSGVSLAVAPPVASMKARTWSYTAVAASRSGRVMTTV